MSIWTLQSSSNSMDLMADDVEGKSVNGLRIEMKAERKQIISLEPNENSLNLFKKKFEVFELDFNGKTRFLIENPSFFS